MTNLIGPLTPQDEGLDHQIIDTFAMVGPSDYPMGLGPRRIFEEMPNVPFKDDVWPKFFRDNAMRVFKLGAQA
jgi:hypothetical protein